MLQVLKYWQLIAGAAGAFALSWLLHAVDVHRIDANWQRKMDEQQIALEKQCKDNQAITKGANDDLQKNYDSIARKLAATKRVQPARCVHATTGEAIPPTSGDGHAGQDGISSDWLHNYAAECETYRSQRIGLEKFIDETWKSKGQ